MNTRPTLATRFGRSTREMRSEAPLTEDQMRHGAPSAFAEGKHASRSGRYTYIPTIDVLRGLKREGFEPFMVAQGVSRIEGRTAYTKHLLRLRHPDCIGTRSEANEIILINSHDGASSFQLTSGLFRYACSNGLVCGDLVEDIRIAHKGNVQHEVIDGAVRVLDGFDAVEHCTERLKRTCLSYADEQAFAEAALKLRFGDRQEGQPPMPITPVQLMQARRPEDVGPSLWLLLQRVSENCVRGGQPGRGAKGRKLHTREVTSIDSTIRLNRALWRLAVQTAQLASV